ncbi:hypothetical protein BU26DRAFT_559804 [Trematosphaeria pertusa]|uniref:F-box domain-containing protein n=1 Tax=Trematosphaeria pertusa TaxID=390896 RepID=A0A6A6IYR1_9PLEO|nr:uncharacterized protein BU26DRAFT_559804 [Trematosphaeria pertusa]KAF2255187.1 hypothetical protein BU26DRAFT_559804 [Trematosphaeria pertusa]
MPRHVTSDDDEPLEDKTAALSLRSKRTGRMWKKQAKRDRKREAVLTLTKLPTELILECLKLLQPGDVLRFGFVNRRFRSLVDANAAVLGGAFLGTRYPLLVQCFPLPKRLAEVDAALQALLVHPKRQSQLGIHRKPYQHVPPPDPNVLCTCLTCVMSWNNLCLVLDFAHWQDNLDKGEPIPIVPRGQSPQWNQQLVHRNANIVRLAIRDPLWHARILETHLDSTIRSIRRHAKNKGNKRKHVEMTDEEAELGTDRFLSKPGPSSFEFPYIRDEYYLLEAYLPNRTWRTPEQKWLYIIEGQHERDLGMVVHFAKRVQEPT